MTGQAKQGLTTTHIILITGFTLVIALIVVLFVFLRPKEEAQRRVVEDYVPAENLIVTEDNVNEVDAQMAEMMKNNMFFVEMNGVWNFKDGSTASHDAVMANSDQNWQDMYIKVKLQGSEDVIYESPALTPGEALKQIKLNEDLDPGTYNAIVEHYPLLPDGTEEAPISFAVDLVIES